MSESVVIGGELQSLPDFNAFKALVAMEIISDVETAFREVSDAAAEYRHDWEAKNYLEIRRADARRRFAPEPLMRVVQEETDDGRVRVSQVPVIDDAGAPIMGPDPLGHLTDADWQANGQALRIPETPSDEQVMAAMVPKAFKLAKTQVLRLMALALTTNRALEEWDGEKDIDAELDRVGVKLIHDATPGELMDLAVAVMQLARDQLRDPFDRATAAWKELRQSREETSPEDPDDAPAPEPMRIETESSPTSSIESPDGTAGTPSRSSIEPAGASSVS
jgi:hypothetical protein